MNQPARSTDARKAARSALLACFPSRESFLDFKETDPAIARAAVPAILRYAAHAGLIEAQTESALLAFLERNTPGRGEPPPPEGFTFRDLVGELTEQNSVNGLIRWLNTLAADLGMPPVQASMFSRLKRDFHPNTPKKRGLLRVLALWIGLNRPGIGWSYERLIRLPRDPSRPDEAVEEKEGARIAFSLQARGHLIDFDAVQWLRSELPRCVKDLGLHHVNWRRIAYTATTASLSIPKQPGPSGEPRLYSQAIRDSLALAHQVAVRWALSDHCDQQRSVVIAIAAGPFDTLDPALQTLLAARVHGDPVIVLTDFARLCSRVAEVKVSFRHPPRDVESLDGRTLSLWTVSHFWSFLYYDFVPELLAERMLPTTRESLAAFREALYYHAEKPGIRHRALTALHRFPQDTLLALEVAKVCVSRRMFHEGNAVLATILAARPEHVVARTLRMAVFRHLMLEQADPSLSETVFRRAVEESRYIQRHCAEDEEVLCEIGLLHFARAVQCLADLRARRRTPQPREERKQEVFRALEEAETFFARGTAVSPSTGLRPIFWQMHARALSRLLREEERCFRSPAPVGDAGRVYPTVGLEFMHLLGWSGEAGAPVSAEQAEAVIRRLLATVQTYTYSNSVLLRNYTPFIRYLFAAFVWDFSPVMPVRLATTILGWLEEAVVEAEALEEHGIGIYAVCGPLAGIQSIPHFVACTRKAIAAVRACVPRDPGSAPAGLLDAEAHAGLRLLLLHLDERIDPGVLLRD